MKLKLSGRYAAWGPNVWEGVLSRPESPPRAVFVRVLSDRSGTAEVLARLREDATLLSRVRHEHILPVEHVTSVRGMAAQVFAGGELASLARAIEYSRWKGQVLPTRVVVDVVASVAVALDAATTLSAVGGGRRVFHAGPTPADVLLDPAGRVRLVGLEVLGPGEAPPSPPGYGPPEGTGYLEAGGYGVGALLLSALTAESPPGAGKDPARHEAEIRKALIRVMARPGEPVGDPLLQMIRVLMGHDPRGRPTLTVVARRLREYCVTMGTQGIQTWAQLHVPDVIRWKGDLAGSRPAAADPAEANPTAGLPPERPRVGRGGAEGRASAFPRLHRAGALDRPEEEPNPTDGVGVVPGALPLDDGEAFEPTQVVGKVPSRQDLEAMFAPVRGNDPPPQAPRPHGPGPGTASPPLAVSSAAPRVLPESALADSARAEAPTRPVDTSPISRPVPPPRAPPRPPPSSPAGSNAEPASTAAPLSRRAPPPPLKEVAQPGEPPPLQAPAPGIPRAVEPAPVRPRLELDPYLLEAETREIERPRRAKPGWWIGLGAVLAVLLVVAGALLFRPEVSSPSRLEPSTNGRDRDGVHLSDVLGPDGPRLGVEPGAAVSAGSAPPTEAKGPPYARGKTAADLETAPVATSARDPKDVAPGSQSAGTGSAADPDSPGVARKEGLPETSSTFRVSFATSDPEVREIEVLCNKGSGKGPSPVIISDAGRGPCRVTFHGQDGRTVLSVAIKEAREFNCVPAERSCR